MEIQWSAIVYLKLITMYNEADHNGNIQSNYIKINIDYLGMREEWLLSGECCQWNNLSDLTGIEFR